ncbi:MAG: type II secretion system F family protein, partial [Planctomycetota bacterium]
MLKALDFSIQSQPSKSAFHGALCHIRDEVANGTPIGEAINEQAAQFDSLTISILSVGEEGGFLEDSFRRAAEISQRREDLRNRLVSAMTYPMFLLVIGMVIGVGLFVFFVPVFEPLFDRMRQRNELPWITSAFLSVSHAVQRFWAPMLGVV